MILDGAVLQERWTNMWWAGSWNTASQYLTGTSALSSTQVHTLEIYGGEDCCDGAQQLQFNNGTGWYIFSSANINVTPPQPSSLPNYYYRFLCSPLLFLNSFFICSLLHLHSERSNNWWHCGHADRKLLWNWWISPVWNHTCNNSIVV